MKNSWTKTFRRLAAGAAVAGATMYSSAMCYAVGFADPSDPIYADGWQAGDDEINSSGFGPWSFDGTYTTNPTPPPDSLANPGDQQAMDDGLQLTTQPSSQHNDIGRAWTLFNPEGRPRGTANGDTGSDIARAGRALDKHLGVGMTLRAIIDNPSEAFNYRGYNMKLNTSSQNLCVYYAGNQYGCSTGMPTSDRLQLKVEQFQFYGDLNWFVGGAAGGETTLSNTDTDGGMQIDVKRISGRDYEVTLTPLDNPGAAVTTTVSAAFPGIGKHINWVQFEFFNTDSDSYPGLVDPRMATDFYISSLSVIPEPGTAALLLLGAGGTLLGTARRRRE
jgi:hypothetical protein